MSVEGLGSDDGQGQERAAADLLPLLDLRSTAPSTEILATPAERLPAALERL